MKKLNVILSVIASVIFTSSCNNKQQDVLYQAIVTVKTMESDQSCYFLLDPNTALKPTNDALKTNPFKKEVRAFTIFYDRGTVEKPAGSPYDWKSAEVATLDSILTKKPVPAGGEYGDDKIELFNSWMTLMEDGYLTLYFEGLWGPEGNVHQINLEETEDPLTFVLRHDACGDSPLYRTCGLIAFDLHDLQIPDKSEFDLVLKYSGYLVDKTVKFHYKDGVYTRPSNSDSNGYYE